MLRRSILKHRKRVDNLDYVTIYEAKSSYGGFSPLLIIPIIIAVVVAFGTIMAWKRGPLSAKITFSAISAVMLLIFFSVVFNDINSRIRVYDPYVNGKSTIIEGIITDYSPNTDGSQLPDRFIVNDKNFAIAPIGTTIWGYPLRQEDGGILKNGMHVRIHFVHYKFENVIMKLEVSEQ